jgi:hypothetical protein
VPVKLNNLNCSQYYIRLPFSVISIATIIKITILSRNWQLRQTEYILRFTAVLREVFLSEQANASSPRAKQSKEYVVIVL